MSDLPHRSAATPSTLLLLAWPIVISRSSQVIVGLSDALLVADLGAASLAATATGAANSFSLLILPMGICFIVSSFSAQFFGKGDLISARRYGWYGLMVAVATQVVCLGAGPAIDPLLRLVYHDEVRELMSGYLRVRLLSGGAAIGIEALANYYGGLGRTRPAMVANVAAMSLNVLGNWVFIRGHLGAPALGVTGSALASTLATWVAFLAFFAWFLWDGRAMVKPALKLEEIFRLLRFGLPSGFNWFFEFLAFIFFVNVVVAGLGTPALAAMNSVFALNAAAFMPAFALASAGAILVGQAIGAEAKYEVGRIVRMTFVMAAAWQCVVGLLYLGIPSLLMVPFAKGAGAEQTMAIGVRMLMVSAAWQLFDAAASTLAEALRAAGDTVFPLLARLLTGWLIFVPGSWLTVHFGGGDVAATFWLVLYLAVLALALFLRFRAGRWREVRLVE